MGGINLYRHVANNPLNAIDPFGLDEHTLTIQSYISQPSVFGFQGDNHGSTNMDGSASNPIVPGAPPIAYDLNVTIDFNTGDLFGSMTLTDFPSFQIFLDGDNIYNHLAKNTLLAPFGLRDQIFDLIKKKIKKKPGCP